MYEAQKLVASAAASVENVGQAKAAAETMLRALYHEVGWKVEVTWDKHRTAPTAAKESPGQSILPSLTE